MDKQWMKNKVSLGNGYYYYCCKHDNCKKPRVMHKPNDLNYNTSIYSDYCNYHYKTMSMINTLIIN